MDRKKFSKLLGSLLVFIFLLNLLALKFYWYFSIWYFDMPMHFLGGLWVGLFLFYLFPAKEISISHFLKILFLVLVVGVGWEMFEISVNEIIIKNPFNSLDTFSDIFFDLSGGTLAALFFFKKIFTTELK